MCFPSSKRQRSGPARGEGVAWHLMARKSFRWGRGSRFRIQGSGFRVQASGFRGQRSGFRFRASRFRVQGSGFWVQGFQVGKGETDRVPGRGRQRKHDHVRLRSSQGSGLRVQSSGFRVQGSGLRVQGSGLRAQGSGFSQAKASGVATFSVHYKQSAGGLFLS